MDYVITKLLIKDRGVPKGSKGILSYSDSKLRKYEESLIPTEYNKRQFAEFKKAVVNREEINIEASVGYNYIGVILNDKIVVNLGKDDFLNIQEYIETPKGRVRITQYPDRLKYDIKKAVSEDLASMTESIYDLDYSDMCTTIFYTNSMTFQCQGIGTISPRAIVEAPTYSVKKEYSEYFDQLSTRSKLLRKLRNEKNLRSIMRLYEIIPQDFKDQHVNWDFDRIVYDFVCKNPRYLYEI